MKSQLIICILFTLILASLNLSFGQNIYLSPDGNDSNPGSIDKPLATLTAARDRAREYRKRGMVSRPVEIIALPGEYFMVQPLLLTGDDCGTTDSPLIIKAENATKAIFRGGVKLTGLEKVNEKLWRVFVPQVAWYNSYFEQLYVNGRRAVRARTPNEGFYYVKKATESVLVRGDGLLPVLAVQDIELDSADTGCFRNFSPQDYQDAVVTFYHRWDNTMKHIAGFDVATNSIRTIGKGMQPWNLIDRQTRYFIDNFRSAMDAHGEWYLDRSGYLYYIPMEGEIIEKTSFFVPVLKELAEATISTRLIAEVERHNPTPRSTKPVPFLS